MNFDFSREIELAYGITKVDSVYFITVVSDNLSSLSSIKSLLNKGFSIKPDAQRVLSSNEYVPTKGFAYKIAIFAADNVAPNLRNLFFMCKSAKTSKCEKPSIEVARLMRESITEEMMELMKLNQIVVCHDPIMIDVLEQATCVLACNGKLGELDAKTFDSGKIWPEKTGFAFIVSATLI